MHVRTNLPESERIDTELLTRYVCVDVHYECEANGPREPGGQDIVATTYRFHLQDLDGHTFADITGDDVQTGIRAVYLARYPQDRAIRPVVVKSPHHGPLGVYDVAYTLPNEDGHGRYIVEQFYVHVTDNAAPPTWVRWSDEVKAQA